MEVLPRLLSIKYLAGRRAWMGERCLANLVLAWIPVLDA